MKYLLLAAAGIIFSSCMTVAEGYLTVTGQDKSRCIARCTYGLLVVTYHTEHMNKYTDDIKGSEMFKKADQFCRQAYEEKRCWF